MKFAYLTLFVGIAIALVAAWFSIVGIVAIFSASWIGALCMGAVIEAGKVVGASWLSRYWNTAENLIMKTFRWGLLFLVLVAMAVTSGGIFGYLSKAHIEQKADLGNNSAQIERLDRLIDIEQRDINDALLVMDQLDAQVQKLIDYDRIRGKEGAKAVREGQKEERTELKQEIESSQLKINELEDKKFELSSTVRELKVEVGPVLYIAALVYDDPESHLDSAVRAVIIILICIFDPLAIMLILAANHAMMVERQKLIGDDNDRPRPEPKAPPEPTPEPETDIEIPVEAQTVGVSEQLDIAPVEDEEPPRVDIKDEDDIEAGDQRVTNRRTTGWLNNKPTGQN